MERLLRYFTDGIEEYPFADTVGMEVETMFVDRTGQPMSLECSQRLIAAFQKNIGWRVAATRGNLVVEIRSPDGKDKLLYELGRHNIEISTGPRRLSDRISGSPIPVMKEYLSRLYEIGKMLGLSPLFLPVLFPETEENLLVIPDERDAVWLELDGRKALELLTRCSSVQFTIDVPPDQAICCLNRLGRQIGWFLQLYPQEELWRRYIHESKARYHPQRYGGPLFFRDFTDYCRKLSIHDIVIGTRLVPIAATENLDIPLYLRSVWWYFRLRRYGKRLCIEVRPLPRMRDSRFASTMEITLLIMESSEWDDEFPFDSERQ